MTEDYFGKGIYGVGMNGLMKFVSDFARAKAEEFLYANVINNFVRNIDDEDNKLEYKLTEHDIESIKDKYRDLLDLSKEVVKTRTKDTTARITRNDYQSFREYIVSLSREIEKFLKDFELIIGLEECEKFVEENKTKVLVDEEKYQNFLRDYENYKGQ